MVSKIKKKHKILSNSNVSVGKDKISNLPDDLIRYIFSFLPIKCVMSTCVLSKRWKYVVHSSPILDFRNWRVNIIENKELEATRFTDFLDTVLCLHEKPSIQKFYLSLDDNINEYEVYKWISILIKRRVKGLFLSAVGSQTFFKFPPSFFTFDSLTVLELDRASLSVPNKVSFPRLKLLRLRNINYVDKIANKLLPNCPILEELSLISCRYLASRVLVIENLALKKLYINSCYFIGSTVKLCAPNLSTITYEENQLADFVFGKFSSLIEAEIDILYYKYYGTRTGVLIKHFRKLSNLNIKQFIKMPGDSFVVYISTSNFIDDFENAVSLGTMRHKQ